MYAQLKFIIGGVRILIHVTFLFVMHVPVQASVLYCYLTDGWPSVGMSPNDRCLKM